MCSPLLAATISKCQHYILRFRSSGLNTSRMQEMRLEEQSRTVAASSMLVWGSDWLKKMARERVAKRTAMRQRKRMRRIPLRPPCGASCRSWRGDDVVRSQGSSSRGRREPAITFNWNQEVSERNHVIWQKEDNQTPQGQIVDTMRVWAILSPKKRLNSTKSRGKLPS